jgi:hypothetical protein
VYLAILIVGGLGYIALAVSGFAHGFGHHAGAGQGQGGQGAHGHIGHAHGQGAHGHQHAAHGRGHDSGHPEGGSLAGVLMSTFSYVSPLTIFVFMVGLGATGILAQNVAHGNALLELAILGGLVFNFLVVRPLMGLMMRFASNPIEDLDSVIAKEAEATTAFDQEGKGIVMLNLNGEHVQLLAALDPAEQHRGVSVHKGDKVVVLDVDTAKQTCRVTRELQI